MYHSTSNMVNSDNSALQSSSKTTNTPALRLLDLPRSAIDLIVYFVAYNDDGESNDLDPIARNALSIAREPPQFPYHICHLLQTCRVLRDSVLKTVFNRDILWSQSFLFGGYRHELQCKHTMYGKARCSCTGTEKILTQRQINFYKTVLPFLRSFNLDRVSNTFSAVAGISIVKSMISAKSPVQEIVLLDPRIRCRAERSRSRRGRAAMLSSILSYTSHTIRSLSLDSSLLKEVNILLSHRLPNLRHLEIHLSSDVRGPVYIQNFSKLLHHYLDCGSVIETLVLECNIRNDHRIFKCLDKNLHLIPHLKELDITINCALFKTCTNLFHPRNVWTEKVTKLRLISDRIKKTKMRYIAEICRRDTFREIEFHNCAYFSLLKDLKKYGVDFGKKTKVYDFADEENNQALLREFQSCCPNLRTLKLYLSTGKQFRVLKGLLAKSRSLTEVSFEGSHKFCPKYTDRLLADGLVQCPSKLKIIEISQFRLTLKEVLAIMNVHESSIEIIEIHQKPQYSEDDDSYTWEDIARILRNMTHGSKFANLRSFHISSTVTDSVYQSWEYAIGDTSNCEVLSDLSQSQTKKIIKRIDYLSSLHNAREAFRKFKKKFPWVDANRLGSWLKKVTFCRDFRTKMDNMIPNY